MSSNETERSREPSRVCGSVGPIERASAAGPQGSPPPEGATEPRDTVESMAGVLGPGWTGGRSSVDFVRAQREPSPLAPAAEDDAVLDRKPVRNHPDAEASNALAGFVIDRMHPWVQGGYVAFSARYGIAGDFLHWLDEHRPGWREERMAVARAEVAEDDAELRTVRAAVRRAATWTEDGPEYEECALNDEAVDQVARAALDAAGVSALRAEVAEWRRVAAEQTRMERDRAEAAEAEVERLRAGITALAERWEPSGLAGPLRDLRALLAGSGEQPGACGHDFNALVDVDEEGHAVCSECEPSLSDRPAPVVPDSTGLEVLLDAIRSMPLRYRPEDVAQEVAQDPAVLAVVGQGVTAEQAWDEGYAAGLRDAPRGEPGGTPNPYRAAVRSGEQEQADG